MLLTSEQIRAARAMLRMDQSTLAKQAGVSVETIKRLERMEGEVHANEDTVRNIENALEQNGLELLYPDDDDFDGSGPGVRLIRSEAKALSVHVGVYLQMFAMPLLFELEEQNPRFFELEAEEIANAIFNRIEGLRGDFIADIKKFREDRKRFQSALAGSNEG